MESKFLKAALFNGMSANAFELGTVLTLGWFWTRIAGCHTVYRGQDGTMDYEAIQAVMEIDDDQVSMANQALAPNTMWHYVRRQLSDCGLESADSPVCVVRIEAAGDMRLDTPNAPLAVTPELQGGAKVMLRWRYSADGQEIAPTGFRVYMDSGSGFDFESPEAAVAYSPGRAEFGWVTAALSAGQTYRFVVRSYRTGAGQSRNTAYVSAVPKSTGPTAITGLRASWQEL